MDPDPISAVASKERVVKQTKRDARKFALGKTLLTLDRQTSKSTEEYAVAKALLNLSVEPAMSS